MNVWGCELSTKMGPWKGCSFGTGDGSCDARGRRGRVKGASEGSSGPLLGYERVRCGAGAGQSRGGPDWRKGSGAQKVVTQVDRLREAQQLAAAAISTGCWLSPRSARPQHLKSCKNCRVAANDLAPPRDSISRAAAPAGARFEGSSPAAARRERCQTGSSRAAAP